MACLIALSTLLALKAALRASLSRILGHSSVNVTEKAYLDVTDDDLKKRYRKFSPLEGIYYKEE